jgi:hypothetical protein
MSAASSMSAMAKLARLPRSPLQTNSAILLELRCGVIHSCSPAVESHRRLRIEAVNFLQISAEWGASSGTHRTGKGTWMILFPSQNSSAPQRGRGLMYAKCADHRIMGSSPRRESQDFGPSLRKSRCLAQRKLGNLAPYQKVLRGLPGLL